MNQQPRTDFIKRKQAQVAALQIFHNMPPPYPFRVHRQISHLAKEIAGTFYEGRQVHSVPSEVSIGKVKINMAADRSDPFRAQFPTVKLFIAWMWPYFVPVARDWLVTMLQPQFNTSQHMKDEIEEAIFASYRAAAYEPDAIGELIARAVQMQQTKKVMVQGHGRRPRKR